VAVRQFYCGKVNAALEQIKVEENTVFAKCQYNPSNYASH